MLRINRLAKCAARFSSASPRPMPWQMDNLLDIGSREIFTEEHDAERERFRAFWSGVDRRRVEEWHERGIVDREFWAEAGAAGVIGIETPAELGGWGKDFYTHCIAMEEQFIHDVPGNFLGQSDLVLPYLAHYGTPEQTDKYVRALRDGTCCGALAMTEPGAGSNLQGMATFAEQDGDDFILNGSKVFITGGINADMVLVCARTDKTAKKAAHGISIFCVDTDLPGFKKGRNLNKLGLGASDTAELFFEDVRLPKEAILNGEEGLNKGFHFLMHDLGRERIMVAMSATISIEVMYEMVREKMKTDEIDGVPRIKQQEIRHKLAKLKTDAAQMRLLTDYGIDQYAKGEMDQQTASIAKYLTCEKCVEVSHQVCEMYGLDGLLMDDEQKVARVLAAMRVMPIWAGTDEIMLELISRTI